MGIKLQEVDSYDDDIAPYADILSEAGLDGVLRLASGQFAQVIPVVTSLVKSIAKLYKSETVWNDKFSITTISDALGQSNLREGIYVALEKLPLKGFEDGEFSDLDETQFTFENNIVYATGKEDNLIPWFQSYLVFNLHQPVEDVLQDKIMKILNTYKDALPDDLLSDWDAEFDSSSWDTDFEDSTVP